MSDYCEHDNYASDCKEPGCNERAHPDGKGAMHHTCVDQSAELATLRDRVQKLEGALREIAAEYERLFGNVATDPPFNNPGLANWTYHKCDQALSPNGTEGGTQPTSG